ncbi:MAG: ATP synthase F1 subunit delta [Bacteroidota bacterium]
MANLRVAQRYAEALMGAAGDQRDLEKVAADIGVLDRAIRDAPEFRMFLRSPIIRSERKWEILISLFEKRLQPATMTFLKLVTGKGRENLLPEIAECFFALRDENLGILSLQVTGLTELGKEQQDAVRKRFEQMTGKKVKINFRLDPSLRGGIVVRLGDTVYDGSVKRQLELLRERFVGGAGLN